MTRPPHLFDPTRVDALQGDRSGRHDPAAIERGVYHALVDVLDAMGGYPMTREDIIDAIGRGVRDAVTQYLDRHGLPESSE